MRIEGKLKTQRAVGSHSFPGDSTALPPTAALNLEPVPAPFLQPAATPCRGWAWRAKSLIDQFLALSFLIACAPALAVISAAIALESRGPVIFRQPRFGVGGKPFTMWKFRTMAVARCDPSGAMQTADNDPRVTWVGRILRRTSLDELPQLLNVLSGEMSLVGPRAHPLGMKVEGQLCEALVPEYHLRHVVRPGITGWAQVNGSRGAVKSAEMLERRVALDLYYVSNWSLLLDVRIIIKTVTVVFSGN